MLGCKLFGCMLFAVARHAVLPAGWLVVGIISLVVEFGLGQSVGLLARLHIGAALIEAKLELGLGRNQVINLFEHLNGYHYQIPPLGDLLVDQAFFIVCINELVPKRVLKPFFGSSSSAVMGVSVVLGIRPRSGQL